MSAPRLRRLGSEFEAIRAEFSGHEHVTVKPLGPLRPPEAYRVIFRLDGLRLEGEQAVVVDHHEIEIRLSANYPREPPRCTPVTPLFHPNVKDYYCIQDHWSAGQSLVDTIAKVGEMIQYRIYNPASPLDFTAARWALENESLFPIDDVSLGSPAIDIEAGRRAD